MAPIPFRFCPRLLLVAALSLPAIGCSLSEYEAGMAREQKRVEQFDEEARLLGGPIELPAPKEEPSSAESPKPAVDVSVRLPWSIATKSDMAMLGELLYHYPRIATPHPASPRKHTGQERPESPFQAVYLAAIPAGDWSDFTNKVQQPFVSRGMSASNSASVVKEPPRRGQMEFKSLTFADTSNPPTTYLVFFYLAHQVQVAIVYQVPTDKVNNPDVTKAVDYSLQSLGVGPDAIGQRQRYRPRS